MSAPYLWLEIAGTSRQDGFRLVNAPDSDLQVLIPAEQVVASRMGPRGLEQVLVATSALPAVITSSPGSSKTTQTPNLRTSDKGTGDKGISDQQKTRQHQHIKRYPASGYRVTRALDHGATELHENQKMTVTASSSLPEMLQALDMLLCTEGGKNKLSADDQRRLKALEKTIGDKVVEFSDAEMHEEWVASWRMLMDDDQGKCLTSRQNRARIMEESVRQRIATWDDQRLIAEYKKSESAAAHESSTVRGHVAARFLGFVVFERKRRSLSKKEKASVADIGIPVSESVPPPEDFNRRGTAGRAVDEIVGSGWRTVVGDEAKLQQRLINFYMQGTDRNTDVLTLNVKEMYAVSPAVNVVYSLFTDERDRARAEFNESFLIALEEARIQFEQSGVKEALIPVEYTTRAVSTAGVTLGDFTASLRGNIAFQGDDTFEFIGQVRFRDIWDFNKGARGIMGEKLTALGRNFLPGRPFRIVTPWVNAVQNDVEGPLDFGQPDSLKLTVSKFLDTGLGRKTKAKQPWAYRQSNLMTEVKSN